MTEPNEESPEPNGSTDDAQKGSLPNKIVDWLGNMLPTKPTRAALSSAQRAERTVKELYGKTYRHFVRDQNDG